MFRRIVVPLDGSRFATTALPHAVALASGADSVIELVSAIDAAGAMSGGLGVAGLVSGEPGAAPVTIPPALLDLVDAERRGREETLREIAGELATHTEAEVEWAILEGEPSHAVAGRVEEWGADLVVLSTHGRGTLERAWLGSVADRLVRRLAVPVLLVRPAEGEAEGLAAAPPSIRRVLVPLDGSTLAEAALAPAAHVAGLTGASLLLLRVTGPHIVVGSPYIPHAAQEHREHFEQHRREATEYLDGVADRLRREGVEVAEVEAREGSPASTILDVAEEGADLVAMATHGHGGFRRLFLGSVSDKVLRGSTRPVLLVRPEVSA